MSQRMMFLVALLASTGAATARAQEPAGLDEPAPRIAEPAPLISPAPSVAPALEQPPMGPPPPLSRAEPTASEETLAARNYRPGLLGPGVSLLVLGVGLMIPGGVLLAGADGCGSFCMGPTGGTVGGAMLLAGALHALPGVVLTASSFRSEPGPRLLAGPWGLGIQLEL